MKLWVFLLAVGAMAQPAFDVASVKQGGPVRPDGLLDINLGRAIHGVVTLTNTTLSECIRYAYGLTNEEQIAGPAWIRDRSIRFSIEAKAPADTPLDQSQLMLQSLLKERFQLELHSEPRKIAHLILTAGKGGPKFAESNPDTPGGRVNYMPGHLEYRRISVSAFAVLLSRVMKEPVLDHTGLNGLYDLKLEWTPDDAPPAADGGPTPKPDVFTAVRQQLGLKLEASKEPLEVLVVDRVEKVPVGN
jgi:uncharacterized protein (TIGR03435 family)